MNQIKNKVNESDLKERERLLFHQSNHNRWFSEDEFKRLCELGRKMYDNFGIFNDIELEK